MRVADWIGKRLRAESDVIFGVTGGCIINCVDGFHKQGLRVIPMHHEQAAAMAADGYARVSGKLGLCFATSGPGGQNLITGLASAYYDSVPVLAIIGQVPSSQHIKTRNSPGLRQFGFQESPNADLALPVVKYATTVAKAEFLHRCLWEALHAAKKPRSGPTVLEICDDVQRAEIEGEEVFAAYPPVDANLAYSFRTVDANLAYSFRTVFASVAKEAKRPILILGAGITQAGMQRQAYAFVHTLKMPTLLSWGGKDLLSEEDPYYVGGFGVVSERTGNYALKHADLIISIGCRLDTHSFGSDYSWLEGKTVLMVDIDQAELNKMPPSVKAFRADITKVVDEPIRVPADWPQWLANIREVRKKFPIVVSDDDDMNPYTAMARVSKHVHNNAIIIPDAGQALSWAFQAWKTAPGQTIFSDFNNSCMGWALPAAIGAAVAAPDRPVYCIIGDGSLMMNLQELQTLAHLNLNVKVVVIDNGGYGMIKQTQGDWGTLEYGVACDERGGLSLPDWGMIAEAFGIRHGVAISEATTRTAFDHIGPVLVRVPVLTGSKIEPKLRFGSPLWEQSPALDSKDQEWIDATLEGK